MITFRLEIKSALFQNETHDLLSGASEFLRQKASKQKGFVFIMLQLPKRIVLHVHIVPNLIFGLKCNVQVNPSPHIHVLFVNV